MPDRAVLAFDTSAAHVAAALLLDDRIAVSRVVPMAKGQAEALFPLLDEVLSEAAITMAELDAIGVGIGPGNFTGIRISVAAARGLALSLGIPAIGVSALEALAHGTRGVRVASLDARRDRIHVQVFGTGAPTRPVMCLPGDLPYDLPWTLPEDVPSRTEPTCIGDRAEAVAAQLRGVVGAPRHPLAVAIARIAAAGIHAPHPRPAPLYLRAADAAPPRDTAPTILP